VRRHGGERLLVVLVGLCLAMGCATPEERYRVLSIFFDEVPLPESMRPPPEAEPLAEERVPTGRRVLINPWVEHDPDCEDCHVSRESKLPILPAPELCWDCHDEEDFAGEVSHGPFAAGACLQCHNPHKSRIEPLLVLAVPDLCGTCHDATTFPELEEHRSEEGDDCIECHNPHAAAGEYMQESNAGGAPPTGIMTARRGSEGPAAR
jgi:predicted CXXCH cytochrome family protein